MLQAPREKSVVQAITRYLKTLKGCWFFNVHGSPMQRKGVPDIIGCYKGRFFWLEVKRPGGKTTQIQDRVIGHIQQAGCALGAVVTSVAQVKELLNEE